jgi:hypothetical protein
MAGRRAYEKPPANKRQSRTVKPGFIRVSHGSAASMLDPEMPSGNFNYLPAFAVPQQPRALQSGKAAAVDLDHLHSAILCRQQRVGNWGRGKRASRHMHRATGVVKLPHNRRGRRPAGSRSDGLRQPPPGSRLSRQHLHRFEAG